MLQHSSGHPSSSLRRNRASRETEKGGGNDTPIHTSEPVYNTNYALLSSGGYFVLWPVTTEVVHKLDLKVQVTDRNVFKKKTHTAAACTSHTYIYINGYTYACSKQSPPSWVPWYHTRPPTYLPNLPALPTVHTRYHTVVHGSISRTEYTQNSEYCCMC